MAKSQIKVLRTKEDFIKWLALHLLERPPIVEVSKATVDYFHGLIELLVDGVPISACYVDWQVFWGEFVLAVAAPGPTARCGVLATTAMPVAWSLALQQQDTVTVAQFVAVTREDAELRGTYIDLEKRHGKWWAISKEPFHRKFGLKVRAPLGKSDRVDATSPQLM